eukprot:g51358.t1
MQSLRLPLPISSSNPPNRETGNRAGERASLLLCLHATLDTEGARQPLPAQVVSQAQPDASLSLRYISSTLPDANVHLLQSVLSYFTRVRRLFVSGHPRAVAKLLAAWAFAQTRAGGGGLYRLEVVVLRRPAGAPAGPWSRPVLPGLIALAHGLRELKLTNVDLGAVGVGGLGCRALRVLELHGCANARMFGPEFQNLALHLQHISLSNPRSQLQEPDDVMVWPGSARWPHLRKVELDCSVGLSQLLRWAPVCGSGLNWAPELTPALTAYKLRVSACQDQLAIEPGAEHFPGLSRGSLQRLAALLLRGGTRPPWLDLELLNIGSRHAALPGDLSALGVLRPAVLAVVDRGSGAAPALARAFLAQPGHKRELAIALAMPTRTVLLTEARSVLGDRSRLRRWARRWERVLADPPRPPPVFPFLSFNLCGYIHHFIRRSQRDPWPLIELQNRLLRALCRLPVIVHARVSFLCERNVRHRAQAQMSAYVRGSYTLLRAWPSRGGSGPLYSCMRARFDGGEEAAVFLACAGLGPPAAALHVRGMLPRQRPWQEGAQLRLLLADYLRGQITRLSRLYQKGQDCTAGVKDVTRTVEQLCRHVPAANSFVLEDPMPRRLLNLLASRLLNGLSTAVLGAFDEDRWWRLVTVRMQNLLATVGAGG